MVDTDIGRVDTDLTLVEPDITQVDCNITLVDSDIGEVVNIFANQEQAIKKACLFYLFKIFFIVFKCIV